MKHLKKITLLLAIFGLLFSISCGSDDDGATVDLSEVEFAFDASNPPIDQTLITNLKAIRLYDDHNHRRSHSRNHAISSERKSAIFHFLRLVCARDTRLVAG